MKTHSIKIFRTVYDLAQHLPDHERSLFWNHVLEYTFGDGEDPEGVGVDVELFHKVKDSLESQMHRVPCEKALATLKHQQALASAT